MNSRYCLDPPRALFEDLLPPGTLTEWSSLWIWPQGVRFSGLEMKALSDAFVGRRMAVWKANAYWKSAAAHLHLNAEVLDRLDRFGAFGPCFQLIGRSISRCTVQIDFGVSASERTIYSDAVWMNINELEKTPDPFFGWRLGSNSALGFLREDGLQPELWARLFQSFGLHGVTLPATYSPMEFNVQRLMTEMESRKLEYLTFVISICASAGIVAGMVCEDSDAKSALVLWGVKEELQNAAAGVDSLYHSTDAAEMEVWLRRGASFVVST